MPEMDKQKTKTGKEVAGSVSSLGWYSNTNFTLFLGLFNNKVMVFWVVILCSKVVGYQCFRGSMVLWNACILSNHYTMSQSRRRLEYSWM